MRSESADGSKRPIEVTITDVHNAGDVWFDLALKASRLRPGITPQRMEAAGKRALLTGAVPVPEREVDVKALRGCAGQLPARQK